MIQNSEILKLRDAGLTRKEIAEKLGISFGTVKHLLSSEGQASACKAEALEVTPEQEKEVRDAAYWRKEAEGLRRELAGAEHERTAVDILVEQAVSLAPQSYQPAPAIRLHDSKEKVGQPQSAVLMLSDTHVGQVIRPDQTLGFGGYNFELFLRRLARLERSVFSILSDHTTTGIPEIVVAILGDMLDGNLNHAVEAGQVNTLFTQFYAAGHALAQFLRNLSRIAPLRIYTTVGNHPRWGTQKKMPTTNRFSNLDQFLYAYTAALTRDIETIQWNLDEQPFAVFDVQGYVFHASHGDHLRGGDKALGVPNHAIGRNVSTSAQLYARAGQRAPNYYLCGHLHRPITLPHSLGEFIVNGGFPGMDGYAIMSAFTPCNPSQKFFLCHPKFGRSATYDLRLDFGDKQEHSYTLPEGFECK